MCFYNVYYYLFIHYKDSLCLLASTFHVYDDDLVMLSSLPGCVGGISLTHCFSNLSTVLCSLSSFWWRLVFCVLCFSNK